MNTKAAAATILTIEWLASLTYAIELRRSHTPALTNFVESERLALITAHVVTKPRRENRAPSPLTVAQEIGFALGGRGAIAEKAGAVLLRIAESAGFIVLTDAEHKRAGWHAAKEVRLSLPAQAQRADIEARLAASDIPDARPLPLCPPVKVEIAPNYDDTDPPPLPVGLAVAEALAPVQSTAWRVNRFMLETLRKLGVDQRDIAALEQAAHYADTPEFFYRCNFDWRGRLYQQGGRLQYTSGSDAARALLEFAHGEPLTPDGRTWLAVHVATCAGERGSLIERMAWTLEHTEAIRKVAADPIGSRFEAAKQPYRFLAACRAWAQVIETPDAPVHLPVAADGTASMFQHYAWLLRDAELGARVNLARGTVGDAPGDFYLSLAEGSEYGRDELKPLAFMLYGKAPKTAAERAVQRLLKAQAPRAWALYLALKRAARTGQALEWTLPDGFRVRQAYREECLKKVWIHTWQGAKPLQASRRELLESLDVKAQARGLPAHVVHSLDACLLRAVVREARTVSRWGVAHDSIAVHPNDGGVLRMAVVEAVECVYGPDVLSELEKVLGCQRVEHAAELPASMRGGWYTFS